MNAFMPLSLSSIVEIFMSRIKWSLSELIAFDSWWHAQLRHLRQARSINTLCYKHCKTWDQISIKIIRLILICDIILVHYFKIYKDKARCQSFSFCETVGWTIELDEKQIVPVTQMLAIFNRRRMLEKILIYSTHIINGADFRLQMLNFNLQ